MRAYAVFPFQMSESKRCRRPRSGVFPGLPGHDDYLVFYFLKTRKYSDPVYIGSNCLSLISYEDRLELREVICMK